MQDIENNMDDLFRKAAADYPLKAGESRWDEIAAAMNKDASPAFKKTNSRKKYSALIVLLLLSGLILKEGVITNKTKGYGKLDAKNQAVDIPAEINTPKHQDNPINDEEQKISGSGQIKQQDKFLILQKTESANTLQNISVKKQAGFLPVTKNEKNNNSPVLPANITNENKAGRELIIPLQEDNSTPEKNLVMKSGENREETGEPEKPIENKQTTDLKKKNQLPKTRGFYFGIAAGPAFSEVKSQGLRKAGFDAGLLAGYQINNNFSVETGVLFSKKYYYSDGKYFNTTKMPPGMDVISLEGSSSIFEIPLKLRYNIFRQRKAQIYTSAGISSSILVNEKNDYLLLVSGSPQKMHSNYNSNHSYLGSTIGISIGYERKISRYTAIRIEPYLKIPLRGVGIGSMQVMSTGLQIAVTRQSR